MEARPWWDSLPQLAQYAIALIDLGNRPIPRRALKLVSPFARFKVLIFGA
jgi:hypothetical protein